MTKYAIISFLQLIAAVSFELIFLSRFYLEEIGALPNAWNNYVHIRNVVEMSDCLLLIICIYFGFTRKQTVCAFTYHYLLLK